MGPDRESRVRAFVRTFSLSALLLMAHPVMVHPGAALASNISLNIVLPAPNQLVGDPLTVVATIQSAFELATVSARVEDRQSPLTFSPSAYCDQSGCHPGWVGTVSLSGLARGQKSVTVAATDIFGGSAQAAALFIFDLK